MQFCSSLLMADIFCKLQIIVFCTSVWANKSLFLLQKNYISRPVFSNVSSIFKENVRDGNLTSGQNKRWTLFCMLCYDTSLCRNENSDWLGLGRFMMKLYFSIFSQCGRNRICMSRALSFVISKEKESNVAFVFLSL